MPVFPFDPVWARRNWWKVAILAVSGWIAFYAAFVVPMELASHREIAHQKASGLGAVAGFNDPMLLWSGSAWRTALHPLRKTAYQRGPLLHVPYPAAAMRTSARNTPHAEDSHADMDKDMNMDNDGRKIVRTSAIELEVKNPAESAEKIRALAERLGGYLVLSEIGDDQAASGGGITIRVPVPRFEEARLTIKQLGTRVESEKTDTSDVTTDYVDKEARLRTLRTEETQYPAILKSAGTVKDALEVSGKLSEVRGQIEQQQAEFKTLSRQVETVVIAVTLRAEADTRVFGLHWRPWYSIKVSSRDGLESLATYTAIVTAALFQLPAILLWLATILFIAVVGSRVLRWIWRKFFSSLRLQPTGA